MVATGLEPRPRDVNTVLYQLSHATWVNGAGHPIKLDSRFCHEPTRPVPWQRNNASPEHFYFIQRGEVKHFSTQNTSLRQATLAGFHRLHIKGLAIPYSHQTQGDRMVTRQQAFGLFRMWTRCSTPGCCLNYAQCVTMFDTPTLLLLPALFS